MRFNSYEFLLLFLPVCLAGYFLLGQRGKIWGTGWLQVRSPFLYSFSIYLFHYPPLVFCAAVLPGKSTDPGRPISLLLTTAVAIYLLAQISEKKRAAVKVLLQPRLVA
jgi:peptidoglycan/LPS O-acetylase OafA/YrhL